MDDVDVEETMDVVTEHPGVPLGKVMTRTGPPPMALLALLHCLTVLIGH